MAHDNQNPNQPTPATYDPKPEQAASKTGQDQTPQDISGIRQTPAEAVARLQEEIVVLTKLHESFAKADESYLVAVEEKDRATEQVDDEVKEKKRKARAEADAKIKQIREESAARAAEIEHEGKQRKAKAEASFADRIRSAATKSNQAKAEYMRRRKQATKSKVATDAMLGSVGLKRIAAKDRSVEG